MDLAYDNEHEYNRPTTKQIQYKLSKRNTTKLNRRKSVTVSKY